MTRINSFKAALAASVCLLPLPALAQSDDSFDIGDKPAAAAAAAPKSDNYVDLGAQYQTGKAWFLNRYSGAVNRGFYGLGDFQLRGRDEWNSGGTKYWDLEGHNLGFDDRSLSASFGQQGTWGATFSYDGIPYYANGQFQSLWTGNGTLAPGIGPASLGETFNQIVPASGGRYALFLPSATNPPVLSSQNLYLQRDVFKGSGKYQLGDWTITGGFRHEHKEGYQANSLTIGGAPSVTTAGSKSAPIPNSFTSGLGYFAQPIDYDTDRYDITAAYSSPRLQAQAGYTFSQFTDNNTEFNAQNPFGFFSPTLATTFGTGGVAGLTAPYVLPPSNMSHQVRALLGYNITPTMRFNANVQYGMELQNAAFLAGIGNTNPGVTQPGLTTASFTGKAQTLDGSVSLTAAPFDKTDMRVAYTVNDYQNRSPQNLWNVNPTGAATNFFSYFNLPFGYDRQTLSAEAGYRLTPGTRLSLSEAYETMHRTYTDVSMTGTNTVTAKVRSSLMDDLFGSLSYSHQNRVAHNYQKNAWWQDTCGSCNLEPGGLMMFSEASRVHDDVKATFDLTPSNDVNASLTSKISKDIYPNATYGLRNNHNLEIGPDVSWQVSPTVNLHTFYTFQQIYYDQASIYAGGSGATAYSAPWNAKSTDSVHTFGANIGWDAIKDVLHFGIDYDFAYGDTAYALGEGVVAYGAGITSPTTGPALAIQSLPDVTSSLNMVSVHGEYTFNPAMTLMFGYSFERFNYKDFMYSAADTGYSNAYLPGTLAPNATIQTVGASLRFRF